MRATILPTVRILRSALFWRILLSTLAVVAVLGGGLYRATKADERTDAQLERLVSHDLKLADDTEVLLRIAADLETGKRGFLLTGDRAFLEPYDKARKDLDDVVAEAIAAADEPEAAKLRDVQRIAHEWIDVISEPQIEARERGEVIAPAMTAEGKAKMDAIRSILTGLRNDTLTVAKQRKDDAFESVDAERQETAYILIFGSVLALATGLWIARDIGGAAARIQDAIDRAGRHEPIVGLPHRNDELGAIGVHLGRMAQTLAEKEARLRSTLEERERALVELSRANRVKTEFLAAMSHEFRTPLVAILGFADLLLASPRENLSPRARESLERIKRNGENLLLLINDVLDLAKAESGKIELRVEPVDLGAIVRSSVGELDSLREGKDITITVEGPEKIEIATDGQRVRQVVSNLVSNALKFTEKGSVTIRLEDGEDVVRIAVVDTGMGIPEHALGELFKDFRQLEAGDGKRYPGTGMGLALSRRLARVLGGDIEVSSIEGKGTTFTVELPKSSPPTSGAVSTLHKEVA